jgi:hypothetical protein
MFNLLGKPGPGPIRGRANGRRVGRAILLGINEGAKLNDVGDGVEVNRSGFAAEAQGLEGNSSTTSEHVEDAWVGSAAGFDVFHGDDFTELGGQPPGVGFEDVALGLVDDFRVTRVAAKFGDEVGRGISRLFARRGGNKRAIDRGAGGDERPARPPEVESGDVAFPKGFLAAGLGGDGLNGNVLFD